MRPLLLLLLSLGVAGAADARPVVVAPPPAPAALDPATARKAEAAADAYLAQAGTPDPQALGALAGIEVRLLEAQAFLDARQPLQAGECYLAALEQRKTIAEAQRPLLGQRLRKVDADLVALSRSLLGQAAFDLGDPPAAGGAIPAK